MDRRLLLVTTLAVLLCSCGRAPAAEAPAPPASAAAAAVDAQLLARFETELEGLRQRLRIPALSAAIVKDQQLVWARGFGYADLENRVRAAPDTPYHLASLTKPFAAVVLLQLLEEGKVGLDDPVSTYGIELYSPGVVRVRHLLTHTSQGTPGQRYQYNGDRYALLSRVIEGASGKSFEELLRERILEPLGMSRTAPNVDPRWGWGDFLAALGLGGYRRNYAQVYRELAQPYQLDPAYQVIPGAYPTHFGAAAGLLSTVADVARFDIALDQDRLLLPGTKEQMFTPARSNSGRDLPYGLGWFAQRYRDTRLIWHYGHWICDSSLIVKVPERDITLIVLANADNLSRPYPLAEGDVLDSTVAVMFLRTFVFPPQAGQPLPAVDWEADEETLVSQLEQITDPDLRELYARELWSYYRVFGSVGQTEQASRLRRVHYSVFPGAAYTGNSWFPGLPDQVPAVGIPRLTAGVAWLLLAWLLLAAGAALFILQDLLRGRAGPGAPAGWWPGSAWVLVGALFGPLGLLAYGLSYRQVGHSSGRGPLPWQRALGASLYSGIGYAVGWTLAMLCFFYLWPSRHPLVTLVVSYAVPLIIGLLLFRAPLLASSLNSRYGRALRQSVLAEVISMNLALAGMLPVGVLAVDRWMPGPLNLASLKLWIVLVLVAAAGALLAYPYNLWLARRGLAGWWSTGADNVAVPVWRNAWGAFLLSLAVLAAAVALTAVLLS